MNIFKTTLLIGLLTTLCFGMGSSNVPPLDEEQPIDENERAMSHVNYIQYELAKTRISDNKFTVGKEMDNILNTINPTTLKHQKLTDAYKEILKYMESIRASHDEQDILAKEMESKRKNAIFNSFSGLGAAFLNPNPVSLASALLMTGFNYARTVNDLETEGAIKDMKLGAARKAALNEERIELWTSASEIFKDNKYESTTFINEKMMDNYMKMDFKLESNFNDKRIAREVYTYLSNSEVKEQFKFFIPYYVTLLKAGYVEDDAGKIKTNYKKIWELSNAEYKRFYIKNPYLYEATRYALLYLMKHQEESVDNLPIDEMIERFKKEGDKSKVSMVEDEYFLVGIYEYMNQKKPGTYYGKIKESLNLLVDLNVENDTTDFYSKYKCLESKNRDNDYCFRLSKKVAKDMLSKGNYEFMEDSSFKVTFSLDAEIEATCTDRVQETIFLGHFDRQNERAKCIEAVKDFKKQKKGSVYEFVAENVGELKHEKINITLKFKMGSYKAIGQGVADCKGELTKPFELNEFGK